MYHINTSVTTQFLQRMLCKAVVELQIPFLVTVIMGGG